MRHLVWMKSLHWLLPRTANFNSDVHADGTSAVDGVLCPVSKVREVGRTCVCGCVGYDHGTPARDLLPSGPDRV